jgi:hypothetical protein
MKVTLWKFPVYTMDEGEEVETLFTIHCDLTPYDPGKSTGDPEKCYPPEGGECEIEEVLLGAKVVPAKDWAALGIDEAKVAEAAWEAAPSKDDEEPPDDDRDPEPRNVSPQDDPHDD